MSARKKDRWQGVSFTRTMGRYTLTVWLSESDSWWNWEVKGGSACNYSIELTEKAAKLAARRCVERLMREGRKKR